MLHLCLHRRRSGTVLSVRSPHLEELRAQNHCGYERKPQENLLCLVYRCIVWLKHQCRCSLSFIPTPLLFFNYVHMAHTKTLAIVTDNPLNPFRHWLYYFQVKRCQETGVFFKVCCFFVFTASRHNLLHSNAAETTVTKVRNPGLILSGFVSAVMQRLFSSSVPGTPVVVLFLSLADCNSMYHSSINKSFSVYSADHKPKGMMIHSFCVFTTCCSLHVCRGVSSKIRYLLAALKWQLSIELWIKCNKAAASSEQRWCQCPTHSVWVPGDFWKSQGWLMLCNRDRKENTWKRGMKKVFLLLTLWNVPLPRFSFQILVEPVRFGYLHPFFKQKGNSQLSFSQ